jgi:hypothetical protein
MRCPGQGCTASLRDDEVSCPQCTAKFIHPVIQGRLAHLYRTERGSPAHVTLVASVVRLLKEGDWS